MNILYLFTNLKTFENIIQILNYGIIDIFLKQISSDLLSINDQRKLTISLKAVFNILETIKLYDCYEKMLILKKIREFDCVSKLIEIINLNQGHKIRRIAQDLLSLLSEFESKL